MFFSKKKEDQSPPPKKGDWIVVIHNWFVDSKGFKHFTFKDMTESEVLKEAKAIQFDNQDTFSKCAFTIIKVE